MCIVHGGLPVYGAAGESEETKTRESEWTETGRKSGTLQTTKPCDLNTKVVKELRYSASRWKWNFSKMWAGRYRQWETTGMELWQDDSLVLARDEGFCFFLLKSGWSLKVCSRAGDSAGREWWRIQLIAAVRFSEAKGWWRGDKGICGEING